MVYLGNVLGVGRVPRLSSLLVFGLLYYKLDESMTCNKKLKHKEDRIIDNVIKSSI